MAGERTYSILPRASIDDVLASPFAAIEGSDPESSHTSGELAAAAELTGDR